MKWLLLIFLSLNSLQLLAYESDQHTVPDYELADVGEDMSNFIHNRILRALGKINATPDKDLTEAKIVALIHKEFSGTMTWQDQLDGVFGRHLTIFPYPDNHKNGLPINYLPSKLGNIYSFSGFHRVLSSSYFVFCSSLKMYGIYFGVDKLGHMFNQGYQYFELYQKSLATGASKDMATQAAVDWGVGTEEGIFGRIVTGVYSNGDLAANYAGFIFYQNLLNPISLKGKEFPPILVFESDGYLKVNFERVKKISDLLRPFFTSHLNEVINPSRFEFAQRGIIKKAIRNRCQSIKKFYQWESADDLNFEEMTTWMGLPYGHRADNLLKVEELCFN